MDNEEKVVSREEPEIDDKRKALVAEWCAKMLAAEKHHEPVFKRMRSDMTYARLGGDKAWVDGKNYVVPVTNRHVNNTVSKMYARNPRAEAKRRKRLMYRLWDGSPQMVQSAMQALQMPPAVNPTTGMSVPNPATTQAMALLQEIQEVDQQNHMLSKVGLTLEVLFNYYTSEQEPNFKLQMKQLVRRARVTGVGYLWLGFQRLLEPKPDVVAQLEDVTSKITMLERLAADAADGEIKDNDASLEQLRLLYQDLQRDKDIIVREGPVFDFPRSTEILVDPDCRQLKGFIGARWVARKFDMTPAKVQEVYKVDVRSGFRPYMADKEGNATAVDDAEGREKGKARVYEVYDKHAQQTFTLCDGWKNFLIEPQTPKCQLERFWPVYVLTFNDIEDEDEIYPPSDVHLIKHAQDGINSSRQGLREHRHANRPWYAAVRGKLEDVDKKNLADHPAHAIIEVNALATGEHIDGVLQAYKGVQIDPNLYETGSYMEDIYRTVGAQETQFGGTSGATATETSIAEAGRLTDTSSNEDDLNEFLSDVARGAGQIMLYELDQATVQKIAGPGAVWPEMNRQQIAEEIELVVKAGSSGRPNRAAELANMERGMPFLIQMPGVNPMVLGEKYANLLELDSDELFVPGLPSITAANSVAGKGGAEPGTGDPQSDPNAQGAEGAANTEQPPGHEPGAQPAFPADTSGAPVGAS